MRLPSIILFTTIGIHLQQGSTNSNAWVELNRLIYQDKTPLPANPFADSIRTQDSVFVAYARPIIDSGGCVLPVETMPVLYIKTEVGDSLSLPEYVTTLPCFSRRLQVFIRIKVAWTGVIREVVIIRYRQGKLKLTDLEFLVNHLRARPHTKFGFPEDCVAVFLLQQPHELKTY